MSVTRTRGEAGGPSPSVRAGTHTLRVVWTRLLPPTIVALGVALRLRQYLSNRSQWLDEIELSRDITRTGYTHLFGALGARQAAPPGYLLVEHTFVTLFGHSDHVLRLLPVVASVAAMFVFWQLTRRVLSPWAQPVALLLFATAPVLVYYSGEAKQYGVEELATLVVASMTLWLCRGPLTLGRSLLWGTVEALTLWFSYPCVIVLTAAAVAVSLPLIWRRHWRELLALTGGCALWFATFLVTLHIQLDQVGGDRAVHAFWRFRGTFAPQPVHLATTLAWLPSVLRHTVANPLDSTAGLLVGALLVVGVAALLAHARTCATGERMVFTGMFVGTFVLAVCAAIVARYPLGFRLAVYGMPLVFLVAASAIDVPTRRRAYLGIIPALLLLLAFDRSLGTGMEQLVHPTTREESKPVLAYIARHREPGDLIVVHRESDAAFGYYGRPLGLSSFGTFLLADRTGCDNNEDLAQLVPLHLTRRFWVVITHSDSGEPSDALRRWVEYFGTVAHVIDSAGAPGAHAYLFASDRPAQLAQHATAWPGRCPTLEHATEHLSARRE